MENNQNEQVKKDQTSNIIQSSNPKPEKVIINSLKRKFIDIGDDTYSTDSTELFLFNRKITSISNEIGSLSNLLKLDLSNNQLFSIPDEIGNLSNLLELDLSKNSINNLPSEIGNITSLTTLILNINNISSLPGSFINLSNLSHLDLSKNAFNSFPIIISNLTNLVLINISSIGINELPDGITNLSNLVRLDISNNKFKAFPKVICSLKYLSSCNISYNEIDSLPDEFTNLEDMTLFTATNCKFEHVPKQLVVTNTYGYIDLKNNKIRNICKTTIELLSRFITVDLKKNLVRYLPIELFEQNNSYKWDLSSDYITVIKTTAGSYKIYLLYLTIQNLFPGIQNYFNGEYHKELKIYLYETEHYWKKELHKYSCNQTIEITKTLLIMILKNEKYEPKYPETLISLLPRDIIPEILKYIPLFTKTPLLQ